MVMRKMGDMSTWLRTEWSAVRVCLGVLIYQGLAARLKIEFPH